MLSNSLKVSSVFAAFLFLVHASSANASGKLSVELNDLSQADAGCQMTFVVQNQLDLDVTDLALEVVLFDKSAKVIKFVKLGAGALPKAKTRVKRFNIANTQCSSIARVLVNDVARCKAGDMTPNQCLGLLALANKSSVDFGL